MSREELLILGDLFSGKHFSFLNNAYYSGEVEIDFNWEEEPDVPTADVPEIIRYNSVISKRILELIEARLSKEKLKFSLEEVPTDYQTAHYEFLSKWAGQKDFLLDLYDEEGGESAEYYNLYYPNRMTWNCEEFSGGYNFYRELPEELMKSHYCDREKVLKEVESCIDFEYLPFFCTGDEMDGDFYSDDLIYRLGLIGSFIYHKINNMEVPVELARLLGKDLAYCVEMYDNIMKPVKKIGTDGVVFEFLLHTIFDTDRRMDDYPNILRIVKNRIDFYKGLSVDDELEKKINIMRKEMEDPYDMAKFYDMSMGFDKHTEQGSFDCVYSSIKEGSDDIMLYCFGFRYDAERSAQHEVLMMKNYILSELISARKKAY